MKVLVIRKTHKQQTKPTPTWIISQWILLRKKVALCKKIILKFADLVLHFKRDLYLNYQTWQRSWAMKSLLIHLAQQTSMDCEIDFCNAIHHLTWKIFNWNMQIKGRIGSDQSISMPAKKSCHPTLNNHWATILLRSSWAANQRDNQDCSTTQAIAWSKYTEAEKIHHRLSRKQKLFQVIFSTPKPTIRNSRIVIRAIQSKIWFFFQIPKSNVAQVIVHNTISNA